MNEQEARKTVQKKFCKYFDWDKNSEQVREVSLALLEAYEAGRRDEREDCAKIADLNSHAPTNEWGKGATFNAKKICTLIRARSSKVGV